MKHVSKTLNILGLVLLVGMFTGNFHFNTKEEPFDFFFVAYMIFHLGVDLVKNLIDKTND